MRVNGKYRCDPALLGLGVALLLILAEINGELTGVNWSARVPYTAQMALLANGLVLIVFGLADNRRGHAAVTPWSKGELALVTVLGAAALALRLWRLDTGLRLLIDEGNSIDALMHIRRRPDFGLLQAPSAYITTLVYPYWNAMTAEIAGRSLSGLRVGSALLGAATVPAVYVLARAVADRSTAIIAAVLLATFPPHVHFSRIALPHIMDAFTGTVAFAAIATALASHRCLHWALAGTALGLTHYGFEAGRLFFTPLASVALGLMLWAQPQRLRAHRAGMATMAVALLLSIAPVYYTALSQGTPLLPRWQESGLRLSQPANDSGASRLLRNLPVALQVYGNQPEVAFFYGGDQALILPWLLPFVIAGVAISTLRWRTPLVLVPLWLAAVTLANAALRDPAVYPRWVVAFPAIGVAGAVGLRALGAVTAPFIGARAAPAAVLVLGLAIGGSQLVYYGGTHVPRFDDQARRAKPYRDAADAVLRAAEDLPPGTDLLFVSDPVIDVHPPRSLLTFLSPDGADARLDGCLPRDMDDRRLAALRPDRDAAFFVAPDDTASVARLRACFAVEGPFHTRFNVPHDKRFVLYVARAAGRPARCAFALPPLKKGD